MTQSLEELLRVVYEISINIDMMSKLVGRLPNANFDQEVRKQIFL